MLNFYEFFAGGGMARAGLGVNWNCLFANDFDHKKVATYKKNWGEDHIKYGDVATLKTTDLPDIADLVWGSFPCQDLSLAGGGAGLKGDRSGTFWPFWNLVTSLEGEDRLPPLVVLENVCGALTSHDGQDFVAICQAFNDAGYRVGAIVVDAEIFVPQSRPRLFVIGVRKDVIVPEILLGNGGNQQWHTRALKSAQKKLPENLQKNWLWWNFNAPKKRNVGLANLIEEEPKSVNWHTSMETKALVAMMSDVNLAKVHAAMKTGKKTVGAIYKRTRRDKVGRKVQRAEVRFDNVAGCLRTPSGGSSRQLILVVEGKRVRSRLLSSREAARLMGLPEEYQLPKNYNEAYHLTGDGVAVPVVRHLAQCIFEPILHNHKIISQEAA